MTQLPTLVRGAWGAVDYQDMNRVFRGLEELLSRAENEGARRPPLILNTLWARLVAQESIADQTCWSFVQIGKLATPAIDTFTNALRSVDYPSGNGRAIDLTGNAQVNDKVLLHELVSFDGRRWFGFTKGGGGSSVDVKLLAITGASAGAYPWDYVVTPAGEAANQTAKNLYEGSPFGHGQSLTFASLGNLTPDKVQGTVIGLRVGPTDWRFDVPNPMVPACATP